MKKTLHVFSISRKGSDVHYNAVEKFNDDFNRMYEQISEIIWTKSVSGKLKFVRDAYDTIRIICKVGLRSITNNVIVVVRFPCKIFHLKALDILRKAVGIKTTIILEDVQSIRYGDQRFDENFIKCECDRLSKFDYVLSPNPGYIKKLAPMVNSKFIDFSIYPYWLDSAWLNEVELDFSNGYTVCFAGNLDKSLFLNKICPQLYVLNLYGKWTNHEKGSVIDRIIYGGGYSQKELVPELHKCHFGLVWDGDELDITKDTTGLGSYLMYNTPNKLCLYLSMGIPVIVWKDSAMAGYVAKHNVGVLISDLRELDAVLNNLSRDEYFELRNNADKMSGNIRQGKDFLEAFSMLCDSEK